MEALFLTRWLEKASVKMIYEQGKFMKGEPAMRKPGQMSPRQRMEQQPGVLEDLENKECQGCLPASFCFLFLSHTSWVACISLQLTERLNSGWAYFEFLVLKHCTPSLHSLFTGLPNKAQMGSDVSVSHSPILKSPPLQSAQLAILTLRGQSYPSFPLCCVSDPPQFCTPSPCSLPTTILYFSFLRAPFASHSAQALFLLLQCLTSNIFVPSLYFPLPFSFLLSPIPLSPLLPIACRLNVHYIIEGVCLILLYASMYLFQ